MRGAINTSSRRSPGRRVETLLAPAIVQHLEGVLELRRDRDVEALAGGQARFEPFVVKRNEVAVRTQLAKGPLHHRGQLRLALAKHDSVGIVGQIITGDA